MPERANITERPKLQTVAKEAGVSLATASQVMRGAGRISQKTRKRVLLAARKLHYVPDGRAASMRSGKNREIGFVIHQIANPFNAEVISGVSDLLESEGYLVSVLDSRDETERQGKNLEAFIRSSRGGLLWVPAKQTPQDTVDLLLTHQIPAVTFLRRAQPPTFDHVGIQNTDATETGTRYLVELGHRQIAFLGGTADVDVRNERIAGYKKVLDEQKLGPAVIWESLDDKRAGLQAMTALMAAHPEITAVVCNGDMVALGASLAIHRKGGQPGKDISVIGFDDVPDAGVAVPALTTLAVSPYKLGRKLARVIIDRIHEPDMPIANILMPAQLVIRETTGAAPFAAPSRRQTALR